MNRWHKLIESSPIQSEVKLLMVGKVNYKKINSLLIIKIVKNLLLRRNRKIFLMNYQL
jgi:hypothetical protein